MDAKLTQSQSWAVKSPGGPILVSAAAGSGKTMVLVSRLLDQILDPELSRDVDEFLIITFTKKAASELRARIARELSARLAEQPENKHLQRQLGRVYLARISTVHAFCAELLREFALDLDLPVDFRVAEESECREIRAQCLRRLLDERYGKIADDPPLRTLVDGLGAGRDDRQIERLIEGVYDTSQCRLYPERWIKSCAKTMDTDLYPTAQDTPWGAYLIGRLQAVLRQRHKELSALLPKLELTEGMAPYAGACCAAMEAIASLGACDTWDEIVSARDRGWGFPRLPGVRNCPAPELQTRFKALRSDAQEEIRGELARFYGTSAEVLSDLGQTGLAMQGLFSLVSDFTLRYAAEKRQLHVMDFSDLEHGAVRLLLRPSDGAPTETAHALSQRFAEIMVDEYQDTNEVQDSIFRALSRGEENLVLVGDVKQSIYRFRMAEPRIFLEKYHNYPLYTPGLTGKQKILLSENFRSGPEILEAANAVFSACMSPRVGDLAYTEQEALRQGMPMAQLPDPAVELWCLSTHQEGDEDTPEKARAEAAFVAGRLRELLDRGAPVREGDTLRPVKPGDVVILLRSVRAAAGIYQEALAREGIACVSDLGQSIFESEELQTLESLLRLIDNAHQDIPLASVLLSPLFGVDADRLARARLVGGKLDLYDAVCLAAAEDAVLARFLTVLSELRDAAELLPLHGLYELVLEKTGLAAIYGSMAGGSVRLARLRQFLEILTAFEEGGTRSLHQFLDHLDSLKEDGVSLPQQQNDQAVTLMSIHKSKGLEFPVVVLADLSHRFNLEDVQNPVQFHKTLGAACNVYDPLTHTRFPSIGKHAINAQLREESISEEMRILYVAMTRAKDRLIMSYCAEHLDKKLTDLTARLQNPVPPALAASAKCMGDWVLMAALCRTEAGELFAVGGYPDCAAVQARAWQIRYVRVSPQASAAAAAPAPRAGDEVDPDRLEAALRFTYPFGAVTTLPAKLTATQLKGRSLDQEADDGRTAPLPLAFRPRLPRLMEQEQPLTPAQRGTAMHLAMQYLDFSKTGSVEALECELQRLRLDNYLTPAQADAVDAKKLFAIFSGPIGQAIRAADRVIREFKFSILVDAKTYYPQAGDEQVLLQGVTDCCLFQNGKLTVIDFKTDRVRPGEEAKAAARYQGQLDAYSLALSRIFETPVEKKLLYFFATDAIVAV